VEKLVTRAIAIRSAGVDGANVDRATLLTTELPGCTSPDHHSAELLGSACVRDGALSKPVAKQPQFDVPRVVDCNPDQFFRLAFADLRL
jgi:hypothetical protein